MAYFELADFKQWLSDYVDYLKDADDNSFDALLQQCADAGCEEIEQLCARSFVLAEDEERAFAVDIDGTVAVKDLIALTGDVLVDANGDGVPETVVPAASLQLLPRTDERGRPGRRFQVLASTPTASVSLLAYVGRAVTVPGDWGYVEPADSLAPAPIIQAAMIRAARLWARRSAVLGTQYIVGDGVFSRIAKNDYDVTDLITGYRYTGYEVS